MSHPKYIKGIPYKEYHRQYRIANREKFRESQKRWRERNPDKAKMNKLLRRARKANARIEKYIKRENIYNWESRICGVCNDKILGEFHIDHIIPLAKGGSHTLKNLQLAHPYCNQSKFTAIIQTERSRPSRLINA